MVIFPLSKNKAPAVPRGTNWQEYRGEATTPIVGVMIPRGVFIIDIDTYKGVTSSDIDNVLGCELDWDNAELQSTLNGGMHYAFKVPNDSDLINNSDLLGIEGFDTRSSGKGYIATGAGYENLTFHDSVIDALQDELPVLPNKAVQLLTHRNEPLEDDDLLTVIASEPLDITEEEVQEYINLLSDDCAEEQSSWLRVGMALWHQLGESGWGIFDKFSQRSPNNYDENANRRRWESFSRKQLSNPVTFASVIAMAGGGRVKSEIVAKQAAKNLNEAENIDDIREQMERIANVKLNNLEMDITLKSIQSKYMELTGNKPSIAAIKREIRALKGDDRTGEYVEDYVFMTATGEYMNRETKAVCGPRAFDVANNRNTPVNSEGEKQPATLFCNDVIEVVENSMYFPSADELFNHNGLDYINTYRAPKIRLVEVGKTDAVDRVINHLKHLLPNDRERNIVLDYLAYNVQNAGVKMNWSIVLQGVQGDGKSLIAEMMQHVMGFNNVRIMNVQTLESGFTGWATGQCMTFIEELKLDNFKKYEVLNNLKPYISNPVVEEHKKGSDPRSVINTTNYFALTNFKDAIPIDANDRRYCILFSHWQKKDNLQKFMDSNPDYYSSLYELVRNNIGELRNWLLNHPINKEFLTYKRAPDTDAKNMMTELSKSQKQVILEDALEEFYPRIDCGNGEIDVTMLGKLVKDANIFDDKWDDFPKTGALKNALLNLGYEAVGRKRTKFSDKGNKNYVYSK